MGRPTRSAEDRELDRKLDAAARQAAAVVNSTSAEDRAFMLSRYLILLGDACQERPAPASFASQGSLVRPRLARG